MGFLLACQCYPSRGQPAQTVVPQLLPIGDKGDESYGIRLNRCWVRMVHWRQQRRRSSEAMRKNTQSAADDAHSADESFDGVRIERIEAIASSPSSEPDQPERLRPERPLAAPGWTKRLSLRAKLARAGHGAGGDRCADRLPPACELHVASPDHTAADSSAGQLEQIPTPTALDAEISNVTPAPHDPDTAYTCMSPLQIDPSTKLIAGEISLWLTRNAGRTWSASRCRAPLAPTASSTPHEMARRVW